jgi:hypothetical protein
MLSSLPVARNYLTRLAIGSLLFTYSHTVPLVQAATFTQNQQPETITLALDEKLIAHHGLEGAGGASIISGASAAGAASTMKMGISKTAMSSSLWGNMLLSMAYQLDPEIQRIATKIGRVNALSMLSITGISGLGLAQSIYAYRQIEPKTYDVSEHDGGHGHVHIPEESRTISTMGIIGSGATLATLAHTVMSKHYARKLTQRQLAIKDRVEQALFELKAGQGIEHAHQELIALVGEVATEEFMGLWQATHP